MLGPCRDRKARPDLEDGAHSLQVWREAENVLNKQTQIADKGGPPAWGLDRGLTTARSKIFTCYEMVKLSALAKCFENTKAPKTDVGWELEAGVVMGRCY
jgi:hypothetical protein